MERVCIASGNDWSCDRPPRRKMSNYCDAHYQQSRTRGTVGPLQAPPMSRTGTCMAAGDRWVCDRNICSVGLCRGHYRQRERGITLFTPIAHHIRLQGERYNADGLRLCSECLTYLSVSSFQRAGRAGKGNDGLQTICAECHRGRWMLRGHGITVAQYDQILDAQGGVCAICHEPPRGKNLAVDHDHSCCPGTRGGCGKCVRGLLCEDCNHGIGNLRDDPAILRSAIDYLAAR